MSTTVAPMTAPGLVSGTDSRPLLMRLVDQSITHSVLAVVAVSLLTALAAQIVITLPFTPVPLTLQTGAVLLGGATLGWARGAASQVLYVLMGLGGLPFFADGGSGWTVVSGATGGYLFGFIVAAAVVGWMAERGQDRSIATSVPAFVFASILIYGFGASWLAHKLDVPLTGASGDTRNAIALGVTPFLLGDMAKAVVASLLTPSIWRWIAPSKQD